MADDEVIPGWVAVEGLLPAVLLARVGEVVLVAAPAVTLAGGPVVVTVQTLCPPSMAHILTPPSRLPDMTVADFDPQRVVSIKDDPRFVGLLFVEPAHLLRSKLAYLLMVASLGTRVAWRCRWRRKMVSWPSCIVSRDSLQLLYRLLNQLVLLQLMRLLESL